ncbi:AfsR/SARP family transcriptional regulator [Spongiactinospora gelatinilytica]|nr:AfsR/SARP family transcriptional regulator [Spongiactinospora gelatinilytica]
MQFGILGVLEVLVANRRLPIRSANQQILLALLLCHCGTVARSGLLIDSLWPDDNGDRAKSRLRLQLHRLRRTLEAAVEITHESGGYILHVSPGSVDAWEFEQLVRRGRQALKAGQVTKGAYLLRTGLGKWRGPALSGLEDIPFLQRQAARLDEERMAALSDRIDADLRLNRPDDLIGELFALVREYPLRERLRGQLMLALYQSGRQAEALKVYRDGWHILSNDLGLEPSPELRRLEAAILASDSSLTLTWHTRGHHTHTNRHEHGKYCLHCSRWHR